ncbi:unnamed protein product [Peniophora sp. CBMAI 1063]|nr:unnamed protein product [Peniophora sp. CBMAI 1063]
MMDSSLLLAASQHGAVTALSMRADEGAFDVDGFITELVGYMGATPSVPEEAESHQDSSPLDWEKIGWKAMARSRHAPAMDFMFGPLDIQQVVRSKKRTKKTAKTLDEQVTPQRIEEKDIQRSENETLENVKAIKDILMESVTDEKGVNLFRFIVNPDDFAQSVENLFHLSFLVMRGECTVQVSEDGEPLICGWRHIPELFFTIDNESQIYVMLPPTGIMRKIWAGSMSS